MEKKKIICVVLILTAVVFFIIIVSSICFATENKTRTKFPTSTTKNLSSQATQLCPLKGEYGQNDLRFNFTNSKLAISTTCTSPVMVFQDGGLYNFTLRAVYDEGNCGVKSGKVLLRVMKYEDYSNIGKFTEDFSSSMNRQWVVYASSQFQTEFRPGEGLLINTTFIDCVSPNETYFNITKISV